MSGIIEPCPFCGSQAMTWTIPAYSRLGRPECEDCGATGPSFIAPIPHERAVIDGLAIEAWNRRVG